MGRALSSSKVDIKKNPLLINILKYFKREEIFKFSP